MSSRLKKKDSPTSLAFSTEAKYFLNQEIKGIAVDLKLERQLESIINCPTNGKDQLVTLKSLLKDLKKVENADNIPLVLKIFCLLFIHCKSKHPLRRTLASFMSNLSDDNDNLYQTLMKAFLTEIFAKEQLDTEKSSEMIASLMENFTKGDKVVQLNGNLILRFLNKCLQVFVEKERTKNGPLFQTEMIHNCLFTLKTIIASLQKCEIVSVALDESLLKNLIEASCNIIEDESFLIECRNAAAMVLPAILLHYPLSIMPYFSKLFICDEHSCDDGVEDLVLKASTKYVNNMEKHSCVVVMLHGILVKLQSYMTHVDLESVKESFMKKLQFICFESKDKNTTILAFKTFHLLVSAMICRKIDPNLISLDVIPFLITHVDHGIDTIRHTVIISLKECFSFLASSGLQVVIDSLTQDYVENGIKSRGKLSVLSSLCEISNITSILKLKPSFCSDLLDLLSDVDLASHSAMLYRVASKKHLSEIETTNQPIDVWNDAWISGISEALLNDCKDKKANTVNYIVPIMLKVNPNILKDLLSDIDCNSTILKFYTAIVFLQTARSMKNVSQEVFQIKVNSSLSEEQGELWKQLLDFSLLSECIIHVDDQVRLDVLSLICNSVKTTDCVDADDIKLVKSFLKYNMAVENPSFRQQAVVCLKKLLNRLFSNSYQVHKANNQNENEIHKLYGDFILWFLSFIFDNLHLSAPYCQVSTILELVSLVTTLLEENSSSCIKEYLQFDQTKKEEYTNKLLKCLNDSYDPNRLLVLTIFSRNPPFTSCLSNEQMNNLRREASTNLYSPQPDVSSVAAYQLCFLTLFGEKDGDEEPCIKMLKILSEHLFLQVNTMNNSLVKASQNAPVHSVLFAIRLIFQIYRLDLKHPIVVSNRKFIEEFLEKFIQVGFNIIELVSPYITNEAPEGQLCNVSLSDVFELLTVNSDDTVLQAHVARMILVCCWRSMKEVSLILGLFISNFINPVGDDSLVSNEIFLEMWDMFNNIMLRSKHAGAYELASVGFLKLCSTLWICHDQFLRKMPYNAVQALIADLTSPEPMENAQVTRRSAGLPFYLQCLCSTEPEINGQMCFTYLMSSLTTLCYDNLQSHDINKIVISLNVLRAFYKDAKMCEDVFPFIAKGVIVALNGFASSLWPIRNSCTLLLSSLMQRIFGVKKVKMTGREFFSRYPQLYPYLVKKTKLMSSDDSDGKQLHPSVFPILLLLSHLYPSTIEGTDSLMKLDVFMEPILRLGHNPVYKTRTMASNALIPLVSFEKAEEIVSKILQNMSSSGENGHVNQNAIHGSLLQLEKLMSKWSSLPLVKINVHSLLLQILRKGLWVMTHGGINPISRKVLLSIVVMFLKRQQIEGYEEEVVEPYMKASIKYLMNTKQSNQNDAGNVLFLRGITTLVIESLMNGQLRGSLVNLFNPQKVRSPTDVLVLLLKMDDPDITGEIVARQQLFQKATLFGGFDVELFEILKKSENKRSFPKLVSLFIRYLNAEPCKVNIAHLIEVYNKLMKKPLEEQREEEILTIMSLIRVILKDEKFCQHASSTIFLGKLWKYIFRCALSSQSYQVRLEVAETLHLLTNTCYHGESYHYQMFHCAFNLLNDCDSDIRTTAASKIYKAFSQKEKDGGVSRFIPQSRYVLENTLFDTIYEKLRTDFYRCALFLLGLQNAHDPVEWLEKGFDANTIKFEVSSSAYKPFVVFEPGKENPYWDEEMVLRYSLRLLGRFKEEVRTSGKINEGKGREVLLKYIETFSSRGMSDGNFKLLSQSIFNICSGNFD